MLLGGLSWNGGREKGRSGERRYKSRVIVGWQISCVEAKDVYDCGAGFSGALSQVPVKVEGKGRIAAAVSLSFSLSRSRSLPVWSAKQQ